MTLQNNTNRDLDKIALGAARKNKNWDRDVLPAVKERLSAYEQESVKPTVRGMFYALVSLNQIKNTKSEYTSLDQHLVDWREDETIPMDSFADNSRRIIDRNYRYYTPLELIGSHTHRLLDLPDSYKSTLPRWQNQPNYVEVWIEKDAMTGTFDSILADREVTIVPNKGWSSLTFAEDNLSRLLWKKQQGKTVYVQYYGDSDPSGNRMDGEDGKMMQKLRDNGINFERVAITDSQIEEYGLEHLKNTDPEVMAKLLRDPNAQHFRDEHDGELFQIELDALQALQPKTFKRLVLSNIDQHFDEHTYQRLLNQHKPASIYRLVKEQVAQLQSDLRDRDYRYWGRGRRRGNLG